MICIYWNSLYSLQAVRYVVYSFLFNIRWFSGLEIFCSSNIPMKFVRDKNPEWKIQICSLVICSLWKWLQMCPALHLDVCWGQHKFSFCRHPLSQTHLKLFPLTFFLETPYLPGSSKGSASLPWCELMHSSFQNPASLLCKCSFLFEVYPLLSWKKSWAFHCIKVTTSNIFGIQP